MRSLLTFLLAATTVPLLAQQERTLTIPNIKIQGEVMNLSWTGPTGAKLQADVAEYCTSIRSHMCTPLLLGKLLQNFLDELEAEADAALRALTLAAEGRQTAAVAEAKTAAAAAQQAALAQAKQTLQQEHAAEIARVKHLEEASRQSDVSAVRVQAEEARQQAVVEAVRRAQEASIAELEQVVK